MTTIYHNPRCSKSRETLALLEEKGIDAEVVLYLEIPPDAVRLTELIAQLGFKSARDLMRKGESEYAELGLDNPALDEAALIAALAAHPRLIERPIVVHGAQARIGRPPASVLELF